MPKDMPQPGAPDGAEQSQAKTRGEARRERGGRRPSPFGEKPLFEAVPNTLYGINTPYYDRQLEDTGYSHARNKEAIVTQDLADQVVLFIGARGGIGEAGLLSAARRGARVVGVSRQSSESDDVKELMGKASKLSGRDSLWIPSDITEPGETERIMEVTLNKFERVDGFVQVAARRKDKAFFRFPLDEFKAELVINLNAPLELTHAVIKQMVKQRSGRFVYISSVAAAHTVVQPSYGPPKAFFESLLKDVALELKNFPPTEKIGINILAPGLVPGTELVADVTPEQAEDIRIATDAERGLKRGEVGEVIAHLLSPNMTETGFVLPMVGKGEEPRVDDSGLLIYA